MDNFVLVEGGTFKLGSIHEITLDSFYISKYQVTQKLYQSVMGENPSHFKGAKRKSIFFTKSVKEENPSKFDNRPVEHVFWYKAVEFCNKLSEKEGLEPCYSIDKLKKDPNNECKYDKLEWTVSCDFSKNGYRLPTEAEWEYAARGGQETCSYTYAGSNNLESVGWYNKNSNKQTHDVGEKEPNELGLYDMSGNVFEWCWDWYNEDIKGGDNPRGPNIGSYRVVRGGSYNSGGSYKEDYHCQVSTRSYDNPIMSLRGAGFRLVLSSSN